MLIFASAVFFLIVTPGPGVLSLAGVGAAYGTRAGLRYLTGLFIGTNLVGFAVITGIGAVVLAQPVLRGLLSVASVGYLLYLAMRIALAGSRIGFIAATRAPGIRDAIILQAINPKAYVVNTTLFAGFPFAPDNYTFEIFAKLIIANVIWTALHLLWLWAGVRLHALNLAPRTQAWINRAMALSMLVVVGLAIWASPVRL